MDLGILADPDRHPYLRVNVAPQLVEQARSTGDIEALVAIADELETVARSDGQLRSQGLYYASLALYLAADADLRKEPSAFTTFNNPLLRRARAATDEVLTDPNLHLATRAAVLVNRGRVAAMSLRWIESAAAFQRAAQISEGDPSHLVELGIGIVRLISVAGPLVPDRILLDGRAALETAVANPELTPGQAQDARTYLEAIEQNRAAGIFNPCPARGGEPVKPANAFVAFCLEHDLLVNYCGGCSDCSLGLSDANLSAFLGDGTENDEETVGYFNQVEEDFCAARYLAFEATHPSTAQQKADSVGHFIDPGGVLALDMGTILEKVAYRTAADILDKIGGLLNTHFALGIKSRDCHFDNIFFDTRKKTKTLRDAANAACDKSISLSALAEMALDWHDPTRPENGLRRRRNRLVHHYLTVVTEESAPAQGGASATEKQSFGRELLAMLAFVKIAAMYYFAVLKQEEHLVQISQPREG